MSKCKRCKTCKKCGSEKGSQIIMSQTRRYDWNIGENGVVVTRSTYKRTCGTCGYTWTVSETDKTVLSDDIPF